MTKGLVLVLVRFDPDRNEFVYSRYEGRALTHRHLCSLPLSLYWVQELRNDPDQFEETSTPQAA
jgi:hypothetical protein